MNKIKTMLSAAKSLEANELDVLISMLGEIRATTQPAVSSQRPDPSDASTMDTPVTMEDSPALMAKTLKDGRIRLWARSSGFGWMAFNVPIQDAIALRDWFAANVAGSAALFSQQDGHWH
jgi:hypothetical protein